MSAASDGELLLPTLVWTDAHGGTAAVTKADDWSAVVGAIEAIDGVEFSGLTVCRGWENGAWQPPYVGLAGGDGGRLTAFVTVDDFTFRELDVDTGQTHDVVLNLAGQPVEVAPSRAVERDVVLGAIRSFVESGDLAPGYRWVGPEPASRDIE